VYGGEEVGGLGVEAMNGLQFAHKQVGLLLDAMTRAIQRIASASAGSTPASTPSKDTEYLLRSPFGRRRDAQDEREALISVSRKLSALQQKLEDGISGERVELEEIDEARDELLWLALRKVDVVVRERTVLEAVIGFTRSGTVELEDGLEDLEHPIDTKVDEDREREREEVVNLIEAASRAIWHEPEAQPAPQEVPRSPRRTLWPTRREDERAASGEREAEKGTQQQQGTPVSVLDWPGETWGASWPQEKQRAVPDIHPSKFGTVEEKESEEDDASEEGPSPPDAQHERKTFFAFALLRGAFKVAFRGALIVAAASTIGVHSGTLHSKLGPLWKSTRARAALVSGNVSSKVSGLSGRVAEMRSRRRRRVQSMQSILSAELPRMTVTERTGYATPSVMAGRG